MLICLLALVGLTDPPPELSAAEAARLWPHLSALESEGLTLERVARAPEAAAAEGTIDLLLWARPHPEAGLELCLLEAGRLRCVAIPSGGGAALREALQLQLGWLLDAPASAGSRWPPEPPLPPLERLDPRHLADLTPPSKPTPPKRASWLIPRLAQPPPPPEGTSLEIAPRTPHGQGTQLQLTATGRLTPEATWAAGLDARLRFTGLLWLTASGHTDLGGQYTLGVGPDVGWRGVHARLVGGARIEEEARGEGALAVYWSPSLGRFALNVGGEIVYRGGAALWVGVGFFPF